MRLWADAKGFIPSRHFNKIIFTFCTLFLFLSFYSNYWHMVSEPWFQGQQKDSESLIVGRLMQAKTEGFFSTGLFMSWPKPIKNDVTLEETYRMFLDGNYEYQFDPYYSQIGMHANFIAALKNLAGWSELKTLQVARVFTALALALLWVLLLYKLYSYLGIGAASFGFLALLSSSWLTNFGKNLYWMPWLWFLPFVAFFYFCSKYPWYEKNQLKKIFFLALGMIALKCSCGYEFLSVVTITAAIPFVFYTVYDERSVRDFFKALGALGGGAFLGFLLVFLVHLGLLTFVAGDLSEAWSTLKMVVSKRTLADPMNVPSQYVASITAPVSPLIYTYLTKHNVFMGLNALNLVYLTVGAALAGLSLVKFMPSKEERAFRALALATGVSVLAPISWFVLAKPHSYNHQHVNFVLWMVPFAPLVASLVGYVFYKGLLEVAGRGMAKVFFSLVIAMFFGVHFLDLNARAQEYSFFCASDKKMNARIKNDTYEVSLGKFDNRVCIRHYPSEPYASHKFKATFYSKSGEKPEVIFFKPYDLHFVLPFWYGKALVSMAKPKMKSVAKVALERLPENGQAAPALFDFSAIANR